MEDIPQDSKDKLTTALTKLSRPTKKTSEIIEGLLIVKEECCKSDGHKIFAGKHGAYNILINILETFQSEVEISSAALCAIIALMSGYPDLLDDQGILVIMSYLDKQKNENILKNVLDWTKTCCIKHEQNRQNIFQMKILPRLKVLLDKDAPPLIVRGVCGVARALVLEDDIRVQYGKSHEHTRALAMEMLCTLTDLLNKFKGDKETATDIILTLTVLVVRNEFCQKVEEAGCLKFISDVFSQYANNEKIIRLCLKLLKGLAGNDDVKIKIIKEGMAPLIISAMRRHQSAELGIMGCGVIAALSLRMPENARVLYNAGAPEVILRTMRIHSKNFAVQKQGSWAIRNIVSRDKSLRKGFLSLGAEEVLRIAMKTHGSDYDAKTALRDLGPGPGNYMLPTTVGYEKHDVTRRRNPAYSMGLKAPADHRKPGPGPYNIKKNQTRFGNDGTPSYSIAGRTGVPVRNINPGPGTYAPERCPLMKETRQPAYTMGGRTPQYKLQQVPAPNQYTVPSYIGPKIPDKQASAAYSMTGRHVGGKEFKSPGPAQYSPPEPNVYKTKLPQYTMTGRTPGVSDRSRNPGPAAYLPTYKHGRSQPQFSFGIRHAETAAPLVLEEDNF